LILDWHERNITPSKATAWRVLFIFLSSEIMNMYEPEFSYERSPIEAVFEELPVDERKAFYDAAQERFDAFMKQLGGRLLRAGQLEVRFSDPEAWVTGEEARRRENCGSAHGRPYDEIVAEVGARREQIQAGLEDYLPETDRGFFYAAAYVAGSRRDGYQPQLEQGVGSADEESGLTEGPSLVRPYVLLRAAGVMVERPEPKEE
jgi:hypothetical protein